MTIIETMCARTCAAAVARLRCQWVPTTASWVPHHCVTHCATSGGTSRLCAGGDAVGATAPLVGHQSESGKRCPAHRSHWASATVVIGEAASTALLYPPPPQVVCSSLSERHVNTYV